MQIQPTNSNNQAKNTNFKASIPVVFWEKVGSEFKLVDNIDSIRRMQDVLVRRANGTGSKCPEAIIDRQKVMSLLNETDSAYHVIFEKYIIKSLWKLAEGATKVGSFYPAHWLSGWIHGKFNPFVYLTTGMDSLMLRDRGKSVAKTNKQNNSEAIADIKGQYVQTGNKLCENANSDELHVIVEKDNKITYKIIKLAMYPSEGEKSPFSIMGYYSQ